MYVYFAPTDLEIFSSRTDKLLSAVYFGRSGQAELPQVVTIPGRLLGWFLGSVDQVLGSKLLGERGAMFRDEFRNRFRGLLVLDCPLYWVSDIGAIGASLNKVRKPRTLLCPLDGNAGLGTAAGAGKFSRDSYGRFR